MDQNSRAQLETKLHLVDAKLQFDKWKRQTNYPFGKAPEEKAVLEQSVRESFSHSIKNGVIAYTAYFFLTVSPKTYTPPLEFINNKAIQFLRLGFAPPNSRLYRMSIATVCLFYALSPKEKDVYETNANIAALPTLAGQEYRRIIKEKYPDIIPTLLSYNPNIDFSDVAVAPPSSKPTLSLPTPKQVNEDDMIIEDDSSFRRSSSSNRHNRHGSVRYDSSSSDKFE